MGKRKKDATFKVTNYQPNDTVTSSSIMVEVDGLKILLDLGAIQSSKLTFAQTYHSNTQKIKSIPWKEIDYVAWSHFHADHSTLLPCLMREDLGFHGEVLTTELTSALSKIIMYDAERINQSDIVKNRDKNGKKYLPYYDKTHIEDLMKIVKCYSYNQEIRLSERVTLEFKPACHCSGASMIYITYKDEYKTKRLLYTGDYTYKNTVARPFTMSVKEEKLKVDVLITESTYGKKDKIVYENESPIDFLERVIIEQVVNKNQTLFIPSFAVHRATTLYLYLYQIFERNKEIKEANIPVYFCGQMMCDAHRVIGKKEYEDYYDEEWLGKKDIFYKEPFKFLTTKKEVEHYCLNNTRKIVISSAGMMDKGYSSLLSESYVANKKVSLLFCGYQSEGSLGGSIREGKEEVVVNGATRKVKLTVCGTIPSLSGHSTHEGIVSFIKSLNQTTLKDIILIHGEKEAKEDLKDRLNKELGNNKKIHLQKQFEVLKFE